MDDVESQDSQELAHQHDHAKLRKAQLKNATLKILMSIPWFFSPSPECTTVVARMSNLKITQQVVENTCMIEGIFWQASAKSATAPCGGITPCIMDDS